MNAAEKAAVVILAAEGAFGIWSAVNPSRFTIRKFTSSQQDLDEIHMGFIIASVLIAGLVFAVVLVFMEGNLGLAIPLGAGAGVAAYFLGRWQTDGVAVPS